MRTDRLRAMSGGPTDPEPDVPTPAPQPEPEVPRGSIAETAAELMRVKKAGLLDGPIFKGTVVEVGLAGIGKGSAVGAGLNAGVLGQGATTFAAHLGLSGIVADALKSADRIAAINESIRAPIEPIKIPPVPKPELEALQGIWKAIASPSDQLAALSGLLEEQVRNTALLAQLQVESGHAQATANRVMTFLTAALVVFTMVLVAEPWHVEWFGGVVGVVLVLVVFAQGTIRTYAARARRRLRGRS
jgi:hypothetical protein